MQRASQDPRQGLISADRLAIDLVDTSMHTVDRRIHRLSYRMVIILFLVIFQGPQGWDIDITGERDEVLGYWGFSSRP